MSRLLIVHFQPLEMYPPIMNFIRVLSRAGIEVDVVSTNCTVSEYKVFDPESSKVKIRRFGAFRENMGIFSKILNYGSFYTGSLLKAILARPGKILYYETLSALPVYYYKRYIKSSVEVFIHYHEYTSPDEYLNGMTLVRKIHSREHFLYRNCSWISHTNRERLKRFLSDEKLKLESVASIWPNFPPASWSRPHPGRIHEPVRFVYLGALSFDTMYIGEFISWMKKYASRSTLDIYTTNMPESSRKKLADLDGYNVKLMDGVDYEDVPGVLAKYDIGLVLYKGHIPNYIFNAPNKLFEYHTCGLDVWFPSVMTSCKDFATENAYPKIVEVDFERLDELNLEDMIKREGCVFRPSPYTAEEACSKILLELMNDSAQ